MTLSNQTRVVPPLAMTDAKLVSSNVTEDDYDEWDSGDDYTEGDYVISVATHTVYRALVASGPSDAGAKDPDVEAANFADPLFKTEGVTRYWQIIGATNLWKLFDEKPSVQCTNSGSIEISLEMGEFINAIGLVNLFAETVQITMTDPTAGVAYDETLDAVDNAGVEDWYTYFFSPFEYVSELAVYDLPPYADATIDIVITGTNAACGQIVLGRALTLGTSTTQGTGFEGYDFSTITTDVFGNLETVRRAATRIHNYRIFASSTRMQAIGRILADLRGGSPALWSGIDDFRIASTVYGYALDWGADYHDANANLTLMTVKVQGTV